MKIFPSLKCVKRLKGVCRCCTFKEVCVGRCSILGENAKHFHVGVVNLSVVELEVFIVSSIKSSSFGYC